jgi:hypothetical protein
MLVELEGGWGLPTLPAFLVRDFQKINYPKIPLVVSRRLTTNY